MTGEKLELLKEFISRNSLQSIEGASLGKDLYPTQVAATVYGILNERVMISSDTGLGKTDVAIAMINMCLKRDKALVIVKRGTLGEMLEKFCDSIRNDLSIGYITNQEKVIYNQISKGNINNCNVIMISSDCLSNDTVSRYLYSIRYNITCVIIDEMHLFSNLQSVESRFMEKILGVSRYAVQLTATPFERDPEQVVNSIWMLDHKAFGGLSPQSFCNKFRVFVNGQFSHYENLPLMKKYIQPYIFNVTREKLNIKIDYDTRLREVAVNPEQRQLVGMEAVKSIKACKGNAYFKLIELLSEYTRQGLKGLVYANLNVTKDFIYTELKRLDYRISICDGSVSKKYGIDKESERAKFRNGELDILITNLVVSSDLECDYIIFYELTQSYKQMTGRGIRSYNDGKLIIDLIYGKGSYEERFYESNVFNRVQMLSDLCDKGMSGLNNVKKV